MDDLGRQICLGGPATRIVSIVPSITELLFALDMGSRVVGATQFCVEPAAARTLPARVGGPKTPDIAAIRRLRPDLVFASVEENSKEDVEALVKAGIPVYVAFPRTVEAGISLVRRLGALLGREEIAGGLAGRLEAERVAVAADAAASGPRLRVFCPIWKDPWMTFNGDTFAHDMLATAGGENIFAGLAKRYPVVDSELVARCRPEVVLLPSEPYKFGPGDIASVRQLLEGATGSRPALRFIDGQALTWYGPRIDWGLRLLRKELASARAGDIAG
jgi:ABC-type Fe3+-hydroxamate transport system substrate-binding protein